MDLDLPPDGSISCSSEEDSPVSDCIAVGEVHSQTNLDSLMSFDLDLSSACSAPEHLVHTWICITPGGDQHLSWESLGVDPWVVSTMTQGYCLQFLHPPPADEVNHFFSGSRHSLQGGSGYGDLHSPRKEGHQGGEAE